MGPKTAKSIFLHAIDTVTPSEWSSYVAEACGNDQELRDDVERLLKAHQQDGDLADEARGMCDAALQTMDHGVSKLAGATIGPYKLREQIGEGGMGVVYVAEQTKPVKRKVALKVIKPGMATKEVVARFEAERQALAMMDHPHIAKVHDGGTTDWGQPYFVMELVQGPPITEFCDSHRLGTRQRLELMEQVCRAVQHAHQRGIIHRDLKPSNVLVPKIDGTPVPKVIDFGVAKAVGQRLTEQTVYTQFSQLVGTPLYMSPEQAELGVIDVDTRSDIYSLGVLLYELLTGCTPFHSDALREAGFDEMRRIIREDEPPKPSARVSTLEVAALSTVSDQRGDDRRRLTEVLKGELDWLVMKSLEKDRNRRYESASSLAADIRRYLSGEAVEACPPSISYRWRKFVHRYRAAVMTAGTVLIALLLGLAGTGWQAWQAAIERDAKQTALTEAESSAAQNKALLKFFIDDLIGSIDPKNALGQTITVAEVVAEADRQLDTQFHDQPILQAALRSAIGRIHLSLGDLELAESHLRQARSDQQRLLGEESAETLATTSALAEVLGYHDLHLAAHDLTKRTVELKRSVLGSEHPDTIREEANLGQRMIVLANFFASMGSTRSNESDELLAECEKLLQQSIVKSNTVFGPNHFETLHLQMILSDSLWFQEKRDEARKLQDTTLASLKHHYGEDHPSTQDAAVRIAKVLDNYDAIASRALLTEVLARQRKIYGPAHPATIFTVNELTVQLANASEFESAMAINDEFYDVLCRDLGKSDSRTQAISRQRIELLVKQGKLEESLKLAKDIYETARDRHGMQHRNTLMATETLADLLYDSKKLGEALPFYRDVVGSSRALLGPNALDTAVRLAKLARCCMDLNHDAQAEKAYSAAIAIFRTTVGDEHLWTLSVKNNLGVICSRLGDHSTASVLLEDVLKTTQRLYGPKNPATLTCMRAVANSYRKQGRSEEAYDLDQRVGEIRYAIEDWNGALGALKDAVDAAVEPTDKARALLWLAMTRWRQAVHTNPSENQWIAARNDYAEALATIRNVEPSPDLEELRNRTAAMISRDEARQVLESLSAKLASDEGNRALILNRARLYSVEQLWDEAAADWGKVIELSEDKVGQWQSQRTRACYEVLQWPEIRDRVAQQMADDSAAWVALGQYFAVRNEWNKAADYYAPAVSARPVGDETFQAVATVLLAHGRPSYEKLCQQVVSRSDEPSSGNSAYAMARLCAIGAFDQVEPHQLVDWANDEIDENKLPHLLHVLGLSQYRAGLLEDALTSLQQSNDDKGWTGFPKAQNWFALAMVYHRQEKDDEARDAFDRGMEMIARYSPKTVNEPANALAPDWIGAEVLRREAEALLAEGDARTVLRDDNAEE